MAADAAGVEAVSYCPWCHNNILVATGRRKATLAKKGIILASSFAAHVQTCKGAPEQVKAAYRSPYP